jgi:hypothetical protein
MNEVRQDFPQRRSWLFLQCYGKTSLETAWLHFLSLALHKLLAAHGLCDLKEHYPESMFAKI